MRPIGGMMKDGMVILIIKSLYRAVLRDVLMQAVKSSDNKLDNTIIQILDTILQS
jgi:hypothetical protein